MRYREGTFVRYKADNLLGLVSGGPNYRVGQRIGCWWHKGGSCGFIHTDEVETLNIEQILKDTFGNEEAKASLIERYLRLMKEDGEVDSRIEDEDVRPIVFEMIKRL